MALKANEYNTGGVVAPTHGPGEGAEGVNIMGASISTSSDNPNINNVDPGSHNAKGSPAKGR